MTTDSIPGYVLAGAVVRRPYSSGGARVETGAVLTQADYLAITYPIRRLFVREGRLSPIYVPESTPAQPLTPGADPAKPDSRHIIHTGGGRYDVIAGTVLNPEPLSKDAAQQLAREENH